MAVKNNLQFDEGLIEISINGDESRKIFLNPADQNIVVRLKEFYAELESKKDKFLELKDDASFEEVAEFQRENDLYFREKIDFVFNSKISDVAFGNTCCFAMNASGQMIAEAFLTAIIPFVRDEIGKRQKESVKKVKNYTSNFKKSK